MDVVEDGYYRVRHENGDFVVGEYSFGHWFFCGNEEQCDDYVVAKIEEPK